MVKAFFLTYSNILVIIKMNKELSDRRLAPNQVRKITANFPGSGGYFFAI